jgi:uncharacterized protein (DUF1810 family)
MGDERVQGMTHRLDRFKRAQDDHYTGFEAALAEIRSGGKRGHWIWYIFPQLAGLGMSPMAREYAIDGESEAAAYLGDPQLRTRLLTITRSVADQLKTSRLSTVMGSEIDAKKLVSSLTLFAEVARRLAAADDAEDAEAYASIASTADAVLTIAASQGYPPCVFTRRQLGLMVD